MSQVHSITPMHKDGVVRCYTHGLPAAHRISQSEKNPGRPYYCCPKSMSDPNRCPFWYWADDPMFKHKPQSSTSIATPSPSPAFPSSSNPRTHNVAPTTPRKRGFQPSLDSPGLTPSQKRTRLMEEAFRGSSPPPPVGTPGRTLTPQTSQKRLDDIKEALSPTKPPNNFQPGIGVDDASPSRPRTTQPSSLTSRGQPSDRLPHESSDTDEDAALWALVTPPSSSLELGSLSDEHGINMAHR
ncbi:hypothetical protein FPV67DRAFT_1030409 [Lyophyllum atratum]|nr:hypothetical protein FPV67DRAFT_1030409 [Lyophyllum atratum]